MSVRRSAPEHQTRALSISHQLQVVARSLPASVMLFALGACVYALIFITIRDFLGDKGTQVVNAFLGPILTLALTVGPYAAIRRARNKYRRTQHRPVINWGFSIPIALVLVPMLAVVYDLCYVAVWLLLNRGPAHLGELVSTATILWKTDSITAILAMAMLRHPLMTVGLLVTVLFGYYGPVSKETAALVEQINEVTR